jgi:(1->4)-alpha-D-glucan 1-alpha-D-glucosylmutase
MREAIDAALKQINGMPGDARSFDKLDELLNDQSYRLAFWRVAADEINYRRFFDVNDLAAIRMELREVFEDTHGLLLELVGSGAVTGLRIDHPDGLYLPNEYFEKLQKRCAKILGRPRNQPAIYMVLEKILTGAELLRKEWPVHGTTGYDFANQVIQLLVDSSAETEITKIFHRFIGHSIHFGHLVYAKKRLVMRLSLANDVNVLGTMLDRLSEQNRWYRDFTLDALGRAVRETIACFPVYRTYLEPGLPVSEEDRAVIDRAITAAKRRNPGIEESVFNYLHDVLILWFPDKMDVKTRAEHEQFVLKFQQSTGPIMAKALEDTAFYIYNRLAALNEVGGEPQQFGLTINTFHQRNIVRQSDWPATLLATSTHDTKRSEDVRARMVAISEIPQTWRKALRRWRTANRRWKRTIHDLEAPDANEECLLYQTLLGAWPIEPDGTAAGNVTSDFVARIQSYMAKALKEAKLNTSWIQPNQLWDVAMHDFVASILEPSAKNKFLPQFLPVVEELARLGAINSLTQVVLKLTSPGVPDIYQGNEIWDYSLVDPDNRRPVDYSLRRRMLAEVKNARAQELFGCWPDGRIKLFVTQRLLHLRRSDPEFFRAGSYVPLDTRGTFADCPIAFLRQHAGKFLLVLTTRLSSRLGFPPIGDRWQDTTIAFAERLPIDCMTEIFTGQKMQVEGNVLKVSSAAAELPFAVYTNF